MSPNVRAAPPTAAALFAGILGAFALSSPPEWYGAFTASSRQLQSWLSAVPTAVAIGAVTAVLAYSAVHHAVTRRRAWMTVAAAATVLIAIRFAVRGVGDIGGLTLLHYAKCITAGSMLGAAVAAVWSRAPARLALTVGVVSTFVVAHSAHADLTPSTSTLGEPFWWILVPALVLTAMCAVVDDGSPARTAPETVNRVAVAAAVIAGTHRLLGALIDRHDGSRLQLWILVGLGLVLVVAVTEFWARRLRSPFLLAATAVAAAAPFVTTLIAHEPLQRRPWTVVAVGGAAVAVGVVLAVRRPSPSVGLAVIAVVPVWTAIAPAPLDGTVWLLVELAVLGVGSGLALGSTLPRRGALAVLGLVVPLVSLVFTTLVDITTTFTADRGTSAPAPVRALLSPPGDIAFDRGAAVALGLVVLFCLSAIRGVSVDEAQRAQPREDEP